jgi:hypothetical protein
MNGTRSVTVFLALGFLVWFLGQDAFSKEKATKGTKTTYDFFVPYLGWAAVAITLVAGTDFEPTEQLSVGFAGLIFFSVALIYGPYVANKLNLSLPALNSYPVWTQKGLGK